MLYSYEITDFTVDWLLLLNAKYKTHTDCAYFTYYVNTYLVLIFVTAHNILPRLLCSISYHGTSIYYWISLHMLDIWTRISARSSGFHMLVSSMVFQNVRCAAITMAAYGVQSVSLSSRSCRYILADATLGVYLCTYRTRHRLYFVPSSRVRLGTLVERDCCFDAGSRPFILHSPFRLSRLLSPTNHIAGRYLRRDPDPSQALFFRGRSFHHASVLLFVILWTGRPVRTVVSRLQFTDSRPSSCFAIV